MSWDPMADEIMAKQQRAYRAMNTPQQNAENDRRVREQVRKNEFLDLLRKDPKFKKEVRTILNESE